MAYITTELRDAPEWESTETVRHRGPDVGGAMPDFNDRRYPLLRLVDPYGDTLFSSYQMAGLIPELIQRHAETHNVALEEVMRLAEKCRDRRRSYLVFIGD